MTLPAPASAGGRIAVGIAIESWPLAEPFVISRGSKTTATVVTATLSRGGIIGRGEAVPYARYGESPESVAAQIEAVAERVAEGAPIEALLPAGAARNALDCARWHLEAQESAVPVAERLAPSGPRRLQTAFTLSLAEPSAMAEKASRVPHLSILKLKLGGAGDVERMAAVRAARPDARLLADANESWTPELLQPLLDAAAAARFELIEQPLPAQDDHLLAGLASPVPLCADESAHTSADLVRLRPLYQAVNVKLDKAGGLTEALAMTRLARELGLKVMVGSMVATSLAIAPAFFVAQDADWVDLDGPLLLARDRPTPMRIVDGWIDPPPAALWG